MVSAILAITRFQKNAAGLINHLETAIKDGEQKLVDDRKALEDARRDLAEYDAAIRLLSAQSQ